jgi:hypothetical protein
MWYPREHYTLETISNYLITEEQLNNITKDEVKQILLDLHSKGYINKDNDPNYVDYKEFERIANYITCEDFKKRIKEFYSIE